MTFGEAVEVMRAGGMVTREGWRDHESKWIARVELRMKSAGRLVLGVTDADWLPFIAMRTKAGKMIPYLASPVDIFATDWIVAQPKEG